MAKPKQIPTYKGLSKKQINTLPLFVDPSIETITEIAEKGNVCRSTIYEWLDDDNFRRALDKKIDTYTDSEMANIWKSLVRKAQAGDTQAIKLYFEMKNKYKDRKEVTGKDGGPVRIESNYSNLSDEELLQLADDYDVKE